MVEHATNGSRRGSEDSYSPAACGPDVLAVSGHREVQLLEALYV